jgi:hypothetical protein
MSDNFYRYGSQNNPRQSSPSQLCTHGLSLKDCDPCYTAHQEEQAEMLGSPVSGGMSVDEDTMDRMVQDASTPTLAMLFKRGKEAGLIQPTTNYGESTGS